MLSNFDFKKLSKEEQSEYIKIAEQMFGPTIVFCETGEPMYFTQDHKYINPIHQFVLDRIKINKNEN